MSSYYHYFKRGQQNKSEQVINTDQFGEKKKKRVFIPMGIKKENQHDKLLPPLHTDDCRKKFNKEKREKRVFIPIGIKNEKKIKPT